MLYTDTDPGKICLGWAVQGECLAFTWGRNVSPPPVWSSTVAATVCVFKPGSSERRRPCGLDLDLYLLPVFWRGVAEEG